MCETILSGLLALAVVLHSPTPQVSLLCVKTTFYLKTKRQSRYNPLLVYCPSPLLLGKLYTLHIPYPSLINVHHDPALPGFLFLSILYTYYMLHTTQSTHSSYSGSSSLPITLASCLSQHFLHYSTIASKSVTFFLSCFIFVTFFKTIQNIVGRSFIICLLQIPWKEGPYSIRSSIFNVVKDWAYVMLTINICWMDGWPAFKIS